MVHKYTHTHTHTHKYGSFIDVSLFWLNNLWQSIFLGSKLTADSDCSHEIKRWLFLGRKAMTNLDSILKSKDITLLTKVHIVKAMYRYESWTIKKTECQRFDAFELWCWRRLLRVPWTAKRSNQSILKGISLEYSLEGLMLKLKLKNFGYLCEEPIHLKRPWCWKRLKAGGDRDGQRTRWLDGVTWTQWTWVWANSEK